MIGDASLFSCPGRRDIEDHFRVLLEHFDPEPERPGLVRTPERARAALEFMTSGYQMDAEKTARGAIFETEGEDQVAVTGVEFYSLCEHHLLPFFGTADISYVPDKKIVGLSKIGRIVDIYARRFQVQERLTRQIGEALYTLLEPRHVRVRMEASHLCMMMRGVQKQNSRTVTEFTFPKKESFSSGGNGRNGAAAPELYRR